LDRGPEPYALEKCARFVSMIPFINDLKHFKDLPDMYTNCQEFLDLGGGDSEEHAILLANFF
jgi:coiled-coil and C2 domain-containing protein 2A